MPTQLEPLTPQPTPSGGEVKTFSPLVSEPPESGARSGQPEALQRPQAQAAPQPQGAPPSMGRGGRAHHAWSALTVARVVEHVCGRLGVRSVAAEFYEHGVSGDAVGLLSLEDLREMARDAADGATDRHSELSRVGSRVRIREALGAFLREHGDAPAERLEATLLGDAAFAPPEASRAAGPAARARAVDDGSVRALLLADHAAPALDLIRRRPTVGAKPAKAKQVFVPVFLTLMIKKLVEDDETSISLVGTAIQRPLIYDLERLKRVGEAEDTTRPYFAMRVNEGESSADDAFVVRKTVPQFIKGANGEEFYASSSTFVASTPLKLNSIISSHPFHVVSASCLIELTSFTGYLDGTGEAFECRPNLLGHTKDLRNLVSVRDWCSEALDEMRSWNVVNSSPCVEYVIDGKHGKGYYCPKVRVTFYLRRAWIQPFIESLMPVIFSNIAMSLMIMRKSQIDLGERLGNVVAIGLTVVFVVPQLSSSLSFQPKMQLNHLYVIWIYTALILVLLFSFGMSKHPFFRHRQGSVRNFLFGLLWGNLVIPITNFTRYFLFLRLLEHEPKSIANPMTFNGRVGEVSEVLSRDATKNQRRLHEAPKTAKVGPTVVAGSPGATKYADDALHAKTKPVVAGKNTAGSAIAFDDLAPLFAPPSEDSKDIVPNPALLHLPEQGHPNQNHFDEAYSHGGAAPWRYYKVTKAVTCGLPVFIMAHVPWLRLLKHGIFGPGSLSPPWYVANGNSVAIYPAVVAAGENLSSRLRALGSSFSASAAAVAHHRDGGADEAKHPEEDTAPGPS